MLLFQSSRPDILQEEPSEPDDRKFFCVFKLKIEVEDLRGGYTGHVGGQAVQQKGPSIPVEAAQEERMLKIFNYLLLTVLA